MGQGTARWRALCAPAADFPESLGIGRFGPFGGPEALPGAPPTPGTPRAPNYSRVPLQQNNAPSHHKRKDAINHPNFLHAQVLILPSSKDGAHTVDFSALLL
jgi:hypothetical protein